MMMVGESFVPIQVIYLLWIMSKPLTDYRNPVSTVHLSKRALKGGSPCSIYQFAA